MLPQSMLWALRASARPRGPNLLNIYPVGTIPAECSGRRSQGDPEELGLWARGASNLGLSRYMRYHHLDLGFYYYLLLSLFGSELGRNGNECLDGYEEGLTAEIHHQTDKSMDRTNRILT